MKTNPLAAKDRLCRQSVLGVGEVWTCSLRFGHVGDHIAYENHDIYGEVLAVAKAAPEAKEDGIPEEPAMPKIDLVEQEVMRWQKAIYELCKKYAGDSIDGGGCDSGDPLDFTLAEISQAFELLKPVASLQDPEGEKCLDKELMHDLIISRNKWHIVCNGMGLNPAETAAAAFLDPIRKLRSQESK